MKYPCNLIQDLLPLYCDRVCSEDSAEAVEEHISACEACRKIYTGMQQSISMDSAEYEKQQLASIQRVKQNMKRKIRKRNTAFATFGMIAGILFVVLILRVMLVTSLITLVVWKGEEDSYTSTDVCDYGVFEEFDGYSRLDLFPEQLGSGMEAHQYSYYYADTFLDPTAQIYFECSYEEEEYAKEIERLQGIQETYDGRVQTVVYDTDSFSYPAYVAIEADNHCYEYALLLGERRIAYVFLQFVKEADVVFPQEYLPKEYEQKEDGYSIYIFRKENGDGYCVY